MEEKEEVEEDEEIATINASRFSCNFPTSKKNRLETLIREFLCRLGMRFTSYTQVTYTFVLYS